MATTICTFHDMRWLKDNTFFINLDDIALAQISSRPSHKIARAGAGDGKTSISDVFTLGRIVGGSSNELNLGPLGDIESFINIDLMDINVTSSMERLHARDTNMCSR
jgi:hypothetical protein